MSGGDHSTEMFYVCAGICRVDPLSNRCIGCGRPWEVPQVPAPPASSGGDAEEANRASVAG